ESEGYGYETAMGRACWPSRDPLEEDGGTNLYSFLSNDSSNWIDSLGLEAAAIPGPYDSLYAAAHAAGSKAVKEENDKVLAAEKARVANNGWGKRYQSKEHGGRLCCGGGKYSYTERIEVEENSKVYVFLSRKCATLGKDWIEVGFWHSHPSEYVPLSKPPFAQPPPMSGPHGLDGQGGKGDTDIVDRNPGSNPNKLPLTMTRLMNDGTFETTAYLGGNKYAPPYDPKNPNAPLQSAKIK
ncbi:MAG: hypothetical protein WCN98_18735, partial [Verrucomicrobiaceae bacterium]